MKDLYIYALEVCGPSNGKHGNQSSTLATISRYASRGLPQYCARAKGRGSRGRGKVFSLVREEKVDGAYRNYLFGMTAELDHVCEAFLCKHTLHGQGKARGYVT
jgi:biotin synthase-related radical SAM superfamily protein